jgi:ABC-type multidrug transport system ATPase subunit
MSLISVKALKKSYDKFAAVKGIDFDIKEGEVEDKVKEILGW